jgi:hypothetical protein
MKIIVYSGYVSAMMSASPENNDMKETTKRPKLTKIESETLEWLKAGRVGDGPSGQTGNTHTALQRKGYLKMVYLGDGLYRREYPA